MRCNYGGNIMSVRRPFDNDYTEFQKHLEGIAFDNEKTVNQTAERIFNTEAQYTEDDTDERPNPYSNSDMPIEFTDTYNIKNEIDANVAQRVSGYDNSKKFFTLMQEELAKTPIENSDMYQGMKLTDDFLEATVGALSAKAYKDRENEMFEKLQGNAISNNVNESIKNIMGADLGPNYYINLSEDYISKNNGVFTSYKMSDRIDAPQIDTQFILSTENYEKALKGAKIELRTIDGKVLNVDAKTWRIKDENMVEMTLQEKLTRYSKVRNRNDLIRNETKKITNVMEHMGIHNVDRMSNRELEVLIKNSTNADMKVIGNTLLDLRKAEESVKIASKSAKRTNRARGGFFKQKMLGDCEMMNGYYMISTSTKIGSKVTRGALTVAHRATTGAAKTATFIAKNTGKALHAVAVKTGASNLYGYQKIYNAASTAGNVMTGVVKEYEALPDTIKETKSTIKKDVRDKKDAFKAGKQDRKNKRKETVRTFNDKTKVGRKINNGMDRLNNARNRISNKFNPLKKAFNRVGNAFGTVGKVFRAPFKLLSKVRGTIIKAALAAAGFLLKVVIVIVIITVVLSAILGMLCTVTSFGQQDGAISIGQTAVNNLRAQGGAFVQEATSLSLRNQEVPTVSGRLDAYGEPFDVTLDDSVTCVYEGTDGTPITSTEFYNIQEILSTAEIHFHGDYSKDSYYEYVRELWEVTHSYYLEYSDVFYCCDEENCDNWYRFSHTSDYLDICSVCNTYTDEDGVEYEACSGHSTCGGHVRVIIHLVAERGVEELTPHAAELSSHMTYISGFGWVGGGNDGIDYYNDTYYAELYEMFMEMDWNAEYGISLGAGTFDASSIAIDGETTQAIHDFLIGCGYSEAGAAAIWGNLQTESHLIPTATNGSTLGIAQWMGNRQTALFNFCANDGLDPYSLEGQLNFLYYELSTGYPQVHAAMMSATDPVEAACYFCAHYEVCYILSGWDHYGDSDYYYFRSIRYQYWQGLPQRKGNASAFYNMFAGQ